MQEKLCASVRKLIPQQLEFVDKEQVKIKWLQKFSYAKWTFMQKQIPRQNEKFNLVSVKFNTKDRGPPKARGP